MDSRQEYVGYKSDIGSNLSKRLSSLTLPSLPSKRLSSEPEVLLLTFAGRTKLIARPASHEETVRLAREAYKIPAEHPLLLEIDYSGRRVELEPSAFGVLNNGAEVFIKFEDGEPDEAYVDVVDEEQDVGTIGSREGSLIQHSVTSPEQDLESIEIRSSVSASGRKKKEKAEVVPRVTVEAIELTKGKVCRLAHVRVNCTIGWLKKRFANKLDPPRMVEAEQQHWFRPQENVDLHDDYKLIELFLVEDGQSVQFHITFEEVVGVQKEKRMSSVGGGD